MCVCVCVWWVNQSTSCQYLQSSFPNKQRRTVNDPAVAQGHGHRRNRRRGRQHRAQHQVPPPHAGRARAAVVGYVRPSEMRAGGGVHALYQITSKTNKRTRRPSN